MANGLQAHNAAIASIISKRKTKGEVGIDWCAIGCIAGCAAGCLASDGIASEVADMASDVAASAA